MLSGKKVNCLNVNACDTTEIKLVKLFIIYAYIDTAFTFYDDLFYISSQQMLSEESNH